MDEAKLDATDQRGAARLSPADGVLGLPQRGDIRAERDDTAQHQGDGSERGALSQSEQAHDRGQQQCAAGTNSDLRGQDEFAASLGGFGQCLDPILDIGDLVDRIVVGRIVHNSKKTNNNTNKTTNKTHNKTSARAMRRLVERGYIDDVIMPHSTRRRVARALAMLRDKHVEMPARKHDNLPV